MRKREKHFFALIMGIILFLSSSLSLVHAAVPLSLALELSSQKMREGESMEVSVSLQNYDENYTENLITTMIVEVSVDTEKLSIDSESIQKDFDAGDGTGFSMVHMSDENNVELQYLNIGDPLAKGNEKLFHFTITANQDITDLTEAVKITYAVMQDGTEAESVKLTVVPFTMVNGETIEQGTIGEQYTSEYGTIAASNVTDGSADSGNTTNAESSVNSGNSTNTESSVNAGNTTNTGSDTNSGNSTNTESSVNTGNTTNAGNSTNTENTEDTGNATNADNSASSISADADASGENSEQMTTAENSDSTKSTANKNALPGLAAGIVLMAAAAGGVYFIQKRKNR